MFPSADSTDKTLIHQALAGDKHALENLVKRHQDWIFNVALSFCADRDEAADIMQEVLIKLITRLASFRFESEFRTWVYRIVKNHFLNMKRTKYESQTAGFDCFARGLDATPDETLGQYAYEVEEKLLVEEAKLSCMKGMLLCLDREQRMIYIIGELFELPDSVGSDIMEISRRNFRVKLHRARQQLYNFMENKCGLINKRNPCRCARKTAGFIRQGFVDPVHLHFQKDAIGTIEQQAGHKVERYSTEVLDAYRTLYRRHPYLQSPEGIASIRALLASPAVRATFNFND